MKVKWYEKNGNVLRKRWNLHFLVIFSNSKVFIAVGVMNDTTISHITIIISSGHGGGDFNIDSDQKVRFAMSILRSLIHSLSLSAFYMLSCSELYLFFICLIRESIASQHRTAYCGWEVAAAYALFKHEHKNGAFYENERERAIATHLSNDTKKEEEICLISLHFFLSLWFLLHSVRQLTIDVV